jgi:hypothetical protein
MLYPFRAVFVGSGVLGHQVKLNIVRDVRNLGFREGWLVKSIEH